VSIRDGETRNKQENSWEEQSIYYFSTKKSPKDPEQTWLLMFSKRRHNHILTGTHIKERLCGYSSMLKKKPVAEKICG
jgi:hypothetical protein